MFVDAHAVFLRVEMKLRHICDLWDHDAMSSRMEVQSQGARTVLRLPCVSCSAGF